MFTRPWALKLLAPTVLVSLALIGACIFVALYLNRLQDNLSKELTENVESTRAAQRLETTSDQLLHLLQSGAADHQDLARQVADLLREAGERLQDAQNLANLRQEAILVGEIATGLEEFRRRWEERPPGLPGGLRQKLASLLDQKVLRPCNELRNFNLEQIAASNLQNQRIIAQLNWGLLAVGLGAPVSGLLLGYAMARGLHHSIYQLSVGIRDAAGRLRRELGSVTLEEEGDLPHLERQVQGVRAEIERVIGELQQREREVLRAEQLAAVGQVAAGVAHELRNPLTSVKMLVQTGLEGEPAAGLPPEDLRIIEHEIRRMEQRIQMFLDFARPAASEHRRADLVAVLHRALALVEGRARRQKVTLAADLPAAPVYRRIDPEQMHQVAVNLLLNALDALPRGGTIWVELIPGPQVTVQVRDTGPGIAPRIRDRLFEPFVSSKETGIGLGLSICKRLVEAHGGTIWGQNAPEGGAVFAFTLPN